MHTKQVKDNYEFIMAHLQTGQIHGYTSFEKKIQAQVVVWNRKFK